MQSNDQLMNQATAVYMSNSHQEIEPKPKYHCSEATNSKERHGYFLRSTVRNNSCNRDLNNNIISEPVVQQQQQQSEREKQHHEKKGKLPLISNSNNLQSSNYAPSGHNGAVKRGFDYVDAMDDQDNETISFTTTSSMAAIYNNNSNSNATGTIASSSGGVLFNSTESYANSVSGYGSGYSSGMSSSGSSVSGRRSPAKKPKSLVTFKEMNDFFDLLDSSPIKQFLIRDSCCLISDKYALAMVFTYFKRARFTSDEFTSLNFFLALYLASDIEEDVEEYKYEIFPWALGPKWRNKFSAFLRKRDDLLRRIGYRAIVSRKCCEEVMHFIPEHVAWSRERAESHGGAVRTYIVNKCRSVLSREHKLDEEEMTMPRGPAERPRPCPLCMMHQYPAVPNPFKYLSPSAAVAKFMPTPPIYTSSSSSSSSSSAASHILPNFVMNSAGTDLEVETTCLINESASTSGYDTCSTTNTDSSSGLLGFAAQHIQKQQQQIMAPFSVQYGINNNVFNPVVFSSNEMNCLFGHSDNKFMLPDQFTMPCSSNKENMEKNKCDLTSAAGLSELHVEVNFRHSNSNPADTTLTASNANPPVKATTTHSRKAAATIKTSSTTVNNNHRGASDSCYYSNQESMATNAGNNDDQEEDEVFSNNVNERVSATVAATTTSASLIMTRNQRNNTLSSSTSGSHASRTTGVRRSNRREAASATTTTTAHSNRPRLLQQCDQMAQRDFIMRQQN